MLNKVGIICKYKIPLKSLRKIVHNFCVTPFWRVRLALGQLLGFLRVSSASGDHSLLGVLLTHASFFYVKKMNQLLCKQTEDDLRERSRLGTYQKKLFGNVRTLTKVHTF